MTQHAGLTAERWGRFTLDQQVLSIGSEMSRGRHLLKLRDYPGARNSYERVLRLVDLTVEINPRRSLRRELLRWRGVVAELYIAPEPDLATHVLALRVLLQLLPGVARQVPDMIEACRSVP